MIFLILRLDLLLIVKQSGKLVLLLEIFYTYYSNKALIGYNFYYVFPNSFKCPLKPTIKLNLHIDL